MKRLEAEEKLKILDALDRYPRALKVGLSVLSCVGVLNIASPPLSIFVDQNATTMLSASLLERVPKDPPPPRRSTRAPHDEPVEAPVSKKRAKAKKVSKGGDVENDDEQWQDKLDDTLPPTNEEESPVSAKRKRAARNVGGWISSDFAQVIDRSWLESDSPPDKFNASTFVPQVGDTIL